MENILMNLANRELLGFCKENGISSNGLDQQGSHVVKNGRGFHFSLVNNSDGYAYVTVTFHKNQTPTFTVSEQAKDQRAAKIKRLRENMPGYILGDLTPYATDSDVLEICDLNDRKAEIHNRALSQKKLDR
jgi:hypothetical protein